jgi:predicted CopG family antitoxin
MNRCMKAIKLDDEAYRRLLSWKRSKGDSFSKVVKRVVPEAGSLGAMVKFVSRRVPVEDLDSILERTIEERSPSKNDSWT